MRREEIETFLAIAEHGTIAGAAARLYISQSTASSRIASLERDIGQPLIDRRRGGRTVRLTEAGRQLVPVAHGLIDLIEGAERIGQGPARRRLVVAAADSLNGSMLIPFYRQFVAAHHDILLELKTMNSADVNQAIETHQATVGISFVIERHPGLASRELFRDRWRVVCDCDAPFARSGSPADLDVANEVTTHYSAEFQTWHRQYFAHAKLPRVIVGNAAQLGAFLDEQSAWSLVPQSIAQRFVEGSRRLVLCDPPEEPPARIAHLVTRRSAGSDSLPLECFERELRAYLGRIGMTEG